MTNTLRKLALAGLASLALGGCQTIPQKVYRGEFRGNDVEIVRLLNGSGYTIIGIGRKPRDVYSPIPYLVASDTNGDRIFDEISLDGYNLRLRFGSFRNHPLFNYANSDSLNAICDSILMQNEETPLVPRRQEQDNQLDTTALKNRISQDEMYLENDLVRLRRAAVANNPNAPTSALNNYLAIENAINDRIEARLDTLRIARGDQK